MFANPGYWNRFGFGMATQPADGNTPENGRKGRRRERWQGGQRTLRSPGCGPDGTGRRPTKGVELGVPTDARGDKPDAPAASGGWFWNELHPTEPTQALSFYDKVIGFSHHSMETGRPRRYFKRRSLRCAGGFDRSGAPRHEAATEGETAVVRALRRELTFGTQAGRTT